MRRLDFVIFDVPFRVQCADRLSYSLVLGNFGAFLSDDHQALPDFSYEIRRSVADREGYNVVSMHRTGTSVADTYELMYYLEKSVTIDVQLKRPDLFFMHAAALERGRRACLLVAPPGGGKSTTTWGLIHNGFGYLSDEMAPIDLDTLSVLPYPHALCLKREPPPPYALPATAIYTSRTIHVPTGSFASVLDAPVPLKVVFFNHYDATASAPTAELISKGEASALIYANALNQLAHENDGLKAAAAITANLDCYRVTTSDLKETCELLRAIVDR